MPLHPILQLILLIVCIAIFGWMGIVWFFIVYFILCLIPIIIVMLRKN